MKVFIVVFLLSCITGTYTQGLVPPFRPVSNIFFQKYFSLILISMYTKLFTFFITHYLTYSMAFISSLIFTASLRKIKIKKINCV